MDIKAIHPKGLRHWGQFAWMTAHRGRSVGQFSAADINVPSGLPCAAPVPAVVVGLCAHGLALVRALADAGVSVVALESNVRLPGYRTHHAEVICIPDINGEALISSLVELSDDRFSGQQPTLLLTNDRMVAVIARHVDRIRGRYRLSWQDCADAVSRLLRKENIEPRCHEAGMAYPRSVTFESFGKLAAGLIDLEFPVIAKPTKPLSTFKTAVAGSVEELVSTLRPHAASAPYLVQQFIPGGDEWIHFCALYLHKGRMVAHFEGHKLRSWPMGHTTVAETQSDSAVLAYTQRFFAGLQLSGPVSLEVKRDAAGKMWVIEPTVGRTDFWVGLCVRAGIALPVIEHFAQLDEPATVNLLPRDVVWINAERDPLAYVWLALKHPLTLLGKQVAPIYFDRSDLTPWYRALGIQLKESLGSIQRRTLRLLAGR